MAGDFHVILCAHEATQFIVKNAQIVCHAAIETMDIRPGSLAHKRNWFINYFVKMKRKNDTELMSEHFGWCKRLNDNLCALMEHNSTA